MRINQAFVDDLIELAFEELIETFPHTERLDVIAILKKWIDDMEESGPRNRAEKHYFEHLEAAVDAVLMSRRMQAYLI